MLAGMRNTLMDRLPAIDPVPQQVIEGTSTKGPSSDRPSGFGNTVLAANAEPIKLDLERPHTESRSRKSAQDDKWSFCVTAGMLWPANQEVYLRAYDSVSEARASIGRYLDFYNRRRPHSSLDGTTPDQAYFKPPLP
ncbi:MAG: putative transposase, partial [Alphaproteobacteria bacterium]|nr:putative transposase [Alphaproteobacteria bacterium]